MPLLRGATALGRAAVVGVIVALAGCAPSAIERATPSTSLSPVRALFEVGGRLSARHGTEALAASFRWRHDRDRDELELVTPLGQTIARLTGNASGVQLQNADGRVSAATDWTALTEQGLGWPLPVSGLVFWVQGAPREGAPFAIEPDVDGRPSVLRQDGWTIVYQAFAPVQDVARPSRLTLSYPGVELRLVIDTWQ